MFIMDTAQHTLGFHDIFQEHLPRFFAFQLRMFLSVFNKDDPLFFFPSHDVFSFNFFRVAVMYLMP